MLSRPGTVLEHAELLNVCDRALNEVGRRSHRFAWLRAGSGAGEDWLVVDAYYPRHRLVVICRDQPGEHDQLYDELVPQHGLRLLTLSAAELGGDRQQVRRAITDMVGSIAPPPPPAPQAPSKTAQERQARAIPLAQVASALAPRPPQAQPQPRRVSAAHADAVARASRFASASSAVRQRPAPRPSPAPRPNRPRRVAPPPRHVPPRDRSEAADVEAVGLFLGLSLVALLLVEMYLDVAKVALDAGHIVLAFGIAIDAVARALGTVAARRVGEPGWGWACAVFGSPAVISFTLLRGEDSVATDPAPLAGLLSLLAGAVIAVGLLGLAL